MEFFERLEAARSRWDVLSHPFYRRWSAGELSRDELAFYAGEYRHAVIALAEASDAAARASEPAVRAELEEHAAEERSHVDLWDRFAAVLEADIEREPLSETAECTRSWTAAANALEGLAVLYAVEAGQPAISQTKLDGLAKHYGLSEESEATAYFSLHAERDHEHAARSRRLLEERLEGADADRLLDVAEAALAGNWKLLDGVEERFNR